MASTTQNLYQCRLCLKRTPTRVNIFGGDFPKMLEILTSIKVSENDGLPKYSCVQCALDVKSALITKKRIIKAHNYLKETLKKQGTPSTSNQKLIVQAQSPRKPVAKNVTPNATEAKKYAKESINKSSADSQNKENPSGNIIPKVEIKLEVLDESQDTNDASIADESNSDFSNKIEEKVSIRRTREKLNYTCKVCNMSFSNRHAYSLHCVKHKKTKCDICSKVIRSDNFKKHLLVHSSGPSVCNLCGNTCKNAVSLASHMFYQHRNVDAYVCEECGAKFNSRYKFFLHKKKAHTGVRSFKCETCGKKFFTKRSLMNHDRMTHQKLRPHICEFCGTGFSSKYALKTHKRQHTNEKPFVCDQCNEGFRQRVSLRNHLKSKHGIEEAKESICSECGKGFATDYALSIHQRLHASVKCQVCSESFEGQEYLNNHMKDVHGVDNDVEKDENQDSEENDDES